MSASPERILSRSRTIAVVVALALIAGLIAAIAASGRTPTPAESAPVGAIASPSAEPSAAATTPVAAAVAPSPHQTTTPTARPSPSETGRGTATRGDSTPAASSSATTPMPQAAPSRTPTPKATKTKKPTPKPTPRPTPTKTASAAAKPSAPHLVVNGKVKATAFFTVSRLKKMSTVSAEYYSRGTEPKELTNDFVGVRLIDILNAAGLSKDAKRVTLTAADDYGASFTLRQVKARYMDETKPGSNLPMIIAYSEDGSAYTGSHPFRLVMGQSVAGDYNRQYWVSIVVSITVQ